ncbi:MAG: DUF692 family protein [Deltaproteobacteria bacterium]|nr:DUF692 family protein [Deltaproteobacteria bacterium]
MRSIHTGIALFAAEELRLAALPLFEAGLIEAVEWTFDHGWTVAPPDWVTALLDAYAAEDRLYGHGLRLSPNTARFDDSSTAWLAELARDLANSGRAYRHVTEHWGFSRTRHLARGAPMPLPSSEAVVVATDRAMHALASTAGTTVGLENLALALSDDDVDAQPAMLSRVLDACNGVLLLDLHNLWCQAENYGRDPRVLASQYPLARVRQLHVAGGTWSDSAYGAPFRRDTHDALVPDDVLALLAWIIPRCPALEAAILERLPGALSDEPARAAWRDEWRALDHIVRAAAREPVIAAPTVTRELLDTTATLDDLATYQDTLSVALLGGGDPREIHAELLADPELTKFHAQIARWNLRALDVALALTAKWSTRV